MFKRLITISSLLLAGVICVPGVTMSEVDSGAVAIHTTSSLIAPFIYGARLGALYLERAHYFDFEDIHNFEFPRSSGTQFISNGGLWVGGVIGEDTIVSTAYSGYAGETWFGPEGTRPHITSIAGPADQNKQDISVDTATPVNQSRHDSYENIEQKPLYIRVTTRTFSWNVAPFNDFVIAEYTIQNFGDSVIRDVWLGVYADASVRHESYPDLAGSDDDLCGYLPDEQIAWLADNDGHLDPFTPNWDSTSVRGVLGVKILDCYPEPASTEPNFNWWRDFTEFPPHAEERGSWGPRKAGTPNDPFRRFNFMRPDSVDFLGTPLGNRNRYYMLSQTEQDYDQLKAALDHTTDGFLPPLDSGAVNLAVGDDTKFLLSTGGFDLAPGDTAKLVVAYVFGENLHQDAKDFVNYFDPFNPQFIYQRFDFTDLLNNARAADSLFNSGYNTPVYSPPPPVALVDSLATPLWIEWLYSENPAVSGYHIYLKRQNVDNLFCETGLTDTLTPTVADRITTYPVTSSPAELPSLIDGALYAVSVAIATPDSMQPQLSTPKLFQYGAPRAPRLDMPYTSEDQRRNNYYFGGSSALLRWSNPNTDIERFNIYRLPDTAGYGVIPGKLMYQNASCPPDFLVCDSLADPLNNGWLCAYDLAPFTSVDGTQTEFQFTPSRPEKYYYCVTAVDSAGSESAPSQPALIYTRPKRLEPLALYVADSTGTGWGVRWDSVRAYYSAALDDYNPRMLYAAHNVTPGRRPTYAEASAYNTLVIASPGLSGAFQFGDTPDDIDWYRDLLRVGVNIVYFGSGVAFGVSPPVPGLFTTSFDSAQLASVVFGLDSVSLISRGSHNPAFSADTLFRYYNPLSPLPSSSDYPALDYRYRGWYVPDYLNDSPIALKGAAFSSDTSLEPLYTYRSGRYPASSLDGELAGFRVRRGAGAVTCFLFSPWELQQNQGDELLRKVLGDIQTDVTEHNEPNLPEAFALRQNYPNPFNPQTTIEYVIPATSHVRLDVYNILGQRVRTLVDKTQSPGMYRVMFSGANLASGIYFYRLKTGEMIQTRKMTLLK